MNYGNVGNSGVNQRHGSSAPTVGLAQATPGELAPRLLGIFCPRTRLDVETTIPSTNISKLESAVGCGEVPAIYTVSPIRALVAEATVVSRSNAATRPAHRGEAGVAAAVSTQRAEKCGVSGAEAAAVKDSTKQTNLQG